MRSLSIFIVFISIFPMTTAARPDFEYEPDWKYISEIRAAARCFDYSDYHGARKHLAECEETKRGWEWYQINARLSAAVDSFPLPELPGDKRPYISDMAIDKTGTLLAVAADSIVFIWELPQHDLIVSLSGHAGPVMDIEFHPDDPILLTVADSTVYLWNTDDGTLLRTMEGHENVLTYATFSPDGSLIASSHCCGQMPELIIREAETGSIVLRSEQARGPLLFGPHGDWLIVRRHIGVPTLLDPETGDTVGSFQPVDRPIDHFLLSPDERSVMGFCQFQTVMWDIRSRRIQARFPTSDWNPQGGSIDTGSDLFAVPIDPHTIGIWDCTTRKREAVLYSEDHDVEVAAFHPSDGVLYSAGRDGMIQLWDVHAPGGVVRVPNPGARKLKIHPSGEKCVLHTIIPYPLPDWRIAIQDEPILICDTHTGAMEKSLRGHEALVYDATFNATGDRLVSTSGDTTIRIWDPASGEQLLRIDGFTKPLKSICFTLSGENVMGCDRDTLYTWNGETGETLAAVYLGATPRGIRLSPSGTRLMGMMKNAIGLWDIPTGDMVDSLDIPSGGSANVFDVSRDGRIIGAGDTEGYLHVWDMPAGTVRFSVPVEEFSIHSLTIHPDGTRIATSNMNGTIRICDTTSGIELMTWYGRPPHFSDVVFSNDGNDLIALDDHITIRTTHHPRVECKARMDAHLHEAAATGIVDSLFREYGISDLVIGEIEHMTFLSAVHRQRALIHARSRIDNPRHLNHAAWSVVITENNSDDEYLRALEWARKAVRREPKDQSFWNTLGFAYLRVSDTKHALSSFSKSDDLRAQYEMSPSPYNALGGAMARALEGNRDKAGADLRSIEELYNSTIRTDGIFRNMVSELRVMISDSRTEEDD